MKVLGLSGSMRENGNTVALVNAVLEPCRQSGIDTEFISLSGKEIRPCRGCERCRVKGTCAMEGDDWQAVADKVLECEVLVIGTPTYFYDVCGQLKNFIDRTYSLYHEHRLSGRSAVAVAVQADSGGDRAIETIEGFLNTHRFSYLGFVTGRGYPPGDVLKDPAAAAKAREIGGRIVRLLKPED